VKLTAVLYKNQLILDDKALDGDVQEAENHSDFHRVPGNLTLAEAAGLLNGQIVVADNR
jgi:hypothetical protein